MPYTLQELAADIRATLKADPGRAGRLKVCEYVTRALSDPLFLTTHLNVMKPGDAHFYDVGDVHSPRRESPVKLVRIEGANLDHVKRSNIKAVQGAAAS
jgi:hypothetical protein